MAIPSGKEYSTWFASQGLGTGHPTTKNQVKLDSTESTLRTGPPSRKDATNSSMRIITPFHISPFKRKTHALARSITSAFRFSRRSLITRVSVFCRSAFFLLRAFSPASSTPRLPSTSEQGMQRNLKVFEWLTKRPKTRRIAEEGSSHPLATACMHACMQAYIQVCVSKHKCAYQTIS